MNRDTGVTPTARAAGVRALGRLGASADETVPALIAVLRNDRSLDVRREAVLALGRFGPAAKSALPALIESLQRWEMRTAQIARACEEEVADVTHHLMQLERAGLVVARGPRNQAMAQWRWASG